MAAMVRDVSLESDASLGLRGGSQMSASAPAPAMQSISARFEVVRPATIRGNGQPQRLAIAILDFSSQALAAVPPTPSSKGGGAAAPSAALQFAYECAPRYAPCAFLTVTATNTSPLPLLAGAAALYIENTFLSKVFCCRDSTRLDRYTVQYCTLLITDVPGLMYVCRRRSCSRWRWARASRCGSAPTRA